jgi:hypothetical protein
MEPMILLIPLVVIVAVGRWVVLRSELRNAGRARRDRAAQARVDSERFDRELTDERMRAGAR